jgi:DNA-binding GntR family transcriptional regulator
MNEKIDNTLLSSRAYQLIKADIVNCNLNPGQFIAQTNLVEKYKVGLTPIREALRQLITDGFVQPVPRLGYVVSPITARDIEEIFEMRLILETSTARLAIARGTELELRELMHSADFTYTYKDRHTYSTFLMQNKSYHLHVANLAKNKRLVQQLSKTMDELTRVFHLGLDIRDSAEEMREDHIHLANALLERNANQAERLIRSEILLSRERVMEALKTYSGVSPTLESLISLNFQKAT